LITIKPFRAFRPPPSLMAKVSCPPYDVVTREEVQEMIQTNLDCFFRIIRSETELPDSISPYDEQVYEKAKDNLCNFMDRKILVQDEKEGFYLYGISIKDHKQFGLVACTAVEDYLQNKIKKHEKTRQVKEEDRTRHMDIVNAQTGPVFTAFRYSKEIDQLIQNQIHNQPVGEFKDNEGALHQIWTLFDETIIKKFQDLFLKVPALYIADGHHRAASAKNIRVQRSENTPAFTGSEPYNYYLSILFPDHSLQILPYYRGVKDLNNLKEEMFF